MSGDQDFTCAKNLVAPAETVLKSGSAIVRQSYDERVRLWCAIRENYSRYENRECGSFDSTFHQVFCSKFEAALLTLAVSFRRSGENYADAEGMYSADELALYEIIERYQVLPSKSELIVRLSAPDGGGSEFLQVHYQHIDSLINEICNRPHATNPFLIHYLKHEWEKYDRRLHEVVVDLVQKNGLRWFFTYINQGSARAEQIVYNISGGSVNLGNGVQVIDSIMNRAGIGNQSEGQFRPSSGGIQVYDSVVNRSAVGGGDDEEQRFCAECGNPLSDGARFCTRCGQQVKCPHTS
jgi:hypothetical protein|nr:zinc ribbon domain-containing protein [Methanoculleus marisnigri]